MIIKRKLFFQIEKYFESRQAIVVTGMRRVGKTTLLTYFYEKIPSPNKIFLDLEDPFNRAIFEKESFEKIKGDFERRGLDFSKKGYVFLDEIQFAPSIPSLVKYFYDHYQIKFFLTGSASFYLKNLFSESLSGRKYLFELYPLDLEEFLWFKKISYRLPSFEERVDQDTHLLFAPFIEEYLLWGGMPEVVLIKNPAEKSIALRDIFSSYFQKEIQTLGDFRKNALVRNLILLLSKRVGQKLDIQRLSSELEVARQTLYEYLEFLAGTYFIALLPALGQVDVALRKQRKVYFVDPGFFSFLQTPPEGSKFENAVYLHLKSLGNIYYWQKRTQEIDFIIKTPFHKQLAFEVKETATSSDITRGKRIACKLGIKEFFAVSLNFVKGEEVKYLFQLIFLNKK